MAIASASSSGLGLETAVADLLPARPFMCSRLEQSLSKSKLISAWRDEGCCSIASVGPKSAKSTLAKFCLGLVRVSLRCGTIDIARGSGPLLARIRAVARVPWHKQHLGTFCKAAFTFAMIQATAVGAALGATPVAPPMFHFHKLEAERSRLDKAL